MRLDATQDQSGNTIVPFLSGTELMADRNRRVLIARIASLVSVPDQHFCELYVATFNAFAEFVQQLPASEAHHHAGLGGLLNHSLEVAENALALRRGYLLPPDSDPRLVAQKADLWSYAVFSAALCHDIGKAVVDQSVQRYDSDRRPVGLWNPWRGAMTNTAYYRITFVRNRHYGLHELVSPCVTQAIIPDAAKEWLGAERDIVSAWIACLSGKTEFAGPLSIIVSKADSISTSKNLGASEARIPSASQVPLHEKLVLALRALLENGQLTLNRPGAAGFVTDTDLWLVSKRSLDLLRAYLIEQGHAGIPTRNDRLMDELQQFGVCKANDDRAIWRARVKLADFDQELTLLRIPSAKLWPDLSSRPTPLHGTIEIVDEKTETESKAGIKSVAASNNATLPPNLESCPAEDLNRGTKSPSIPDSNTEGDDDASNEPDGFIAWLREGLQTGKFEVNTANALVHTVDEGLLLVSPFIFQKYVGSAGDWHHVQNRFFRARLHRRNAERTNIIHYKVEGKRRSSLLKGVLIPDPEHMLNVELPEPNTHLVLQTKL